MTGAEPAGAKKSLARLMGAACLAMGLPAPASYADTELSGSIGGELRSFVQSPAFPGQLETFQPSVILEGEFEWRSDNRADQVVIAPFARIDGQDDSRTHFDLREAYYLHVGNGWEVQVGAAKVFWGVTESRHLVDIIGQDDAVEDIDEEDKLGQPMIKFARQQDWGELSLFLLPFFRERTFPGLDGRLRTPLVVDTDRGGVDEGLDVAVRYSHYIGDIDIGAFIFHGTDRDPRLLLSENAASLIPVYDRVTQGGIDLQYTTGAWLWKFEGLLRGGGDGEEGGGDNFFGAAVAGFEYTFFNVNTRGWDVGVLLEYQYDGRDLSSFSSAPFTAANNDIFAGTRLAWNDIQDTAILAGVIVDAENGAIAGLVEAERRLGTDWFAALESRFFANTGNDPFAGVFARDSVITLRATRYF